MNYLAELSRAIDEVGYYPAVVFEAVNLAVAGEDVCAYVMQHEATFDQEALHRHMTVVALTPTRLIISHTDENAPDEIRSFLTATSASEAVKLTAINSVVVSRTYRDPANISGDDSIEEVVITLGWGAVNRHEIAPAMCDDPNCEAEHGFSANSVNEDLSIRVSKAADGAARVRQAMAFAKALSEVTSHVSGNR